MSYCTEVDVFGSCNVQIKVERMAQESRVQKAIQEQERQFGKMTRSISGRAFMHLSTLLVCICAVQHRQDFARHELSVLP